MMRGAWPSAPYYPSQHPANRQPCEWGHRDEPASLSSEYSHVTEPSRDHRGKARMAQQNNELIKGFLFKPLCFGAVCYTAIDNWHRDSVPSLQNIVKNIWDYLGCIGYDKILWLKVNLDSEISLLFKKCMSLSLSPSKIFSRAGAQYNAWFLGSTSFEQIQRLGSGPA